MSRCSGTGPPPRNCSVPHGKSTPNRKTSPTPSDAGVSGRSMIIGSSRAGPWPGPTTIRREHPRPDPARTRSESLRGSTPQEVRARLGGQPNRKVFSATQGQLLEQWIYYGAKENQYINFLHRSGSPLPRVVAYYSRPRSAEDPTAPPLSPSARLENPSLPAWDHSFMQDCSRDSSWCRAHGTRVQPKSSRSQPKYFCHIYSRNVDYSSQGGRRSVSSERCPAIRCLPPFSSMRIFGANIY